MTNKTRTHCRYETISINGRPSDISVKNSSNYYVKCVRACQPRESRVKGGEDGNWVLESS